MSAMILAIDQGSSKTEVAVVGPSGTILGTGCAGGACYFSVGIELALQQIQTATGQALAMAGVQLSSISHISGGIAGANWPEEIEMLTRTLSQSLGVPDVRVYNDCVPALYGGAEGKNAVVLCAGSGFNCAVMLDGEIHSVLNNYIAARDQGGLGLAQRALEAVFESYIGIRQETKLRRELLAFWGLQNVDQLVLGRDRDTLSKPTHTAAPVVIETARNNDQVALDVICEFSRSIARYACGSIRKYGLIGKPCEVVLSGGLFKAGNPLFLQAIAVEVYRLSQDARVISARYEPVLGAALLGLSAIGASEAAMQICRELAPDFGLTRANERET